MVSNAEKMLKAKEFFIDSVGVNPALPVRDTNISKILKTKKQTTKPTQFNFYTINKENGVKIKYLKKLDKHGEIISRGLALALVGVLSLRNIKLPKIIQTKITEPSAKILKEAKTKVTQPITKILPSKRSKGVTSDAMVKHLKQFEALRLKAYKPTKNEKYYTIGYGHYGKDVKPNMTITEQQAEELFRNDLKRFENAVNKHVKVDITQNQFDALVSFTYNVGESALAKSTLLKKLNAGDYQGASEEFKKYDKQTKRDKKGKPIKDAKGKNIVETLAGLTKRRKYESDLFKSDIGTNTKAVNAKPKKQVTTKISKKPTKSNIAQVGGKVGGYTLKSNNVKISAESKSYLLGLEGSGIVTAGINGSHNKSKSGRGHADGYKLDFSVNDKSIKGWGDLIINLLKNKRTYRINLEYGKKTYSLKEAQAIVAYVKKNSKGLDYSKIRLIKETKHSNGRHLDVVILSESEVQPKKVSNKNEILAVSNAQKPKVSKKVESITKPQAQKLSTNVKNISQNTANYGAIGRINDRMTYKNSHR
jgi:GH24 family phage-related lysozyme (muramidase)